MKKKTFIKVVAGFVLAMTLCLGTAMPAFASSGPVVSGTEADPAEIAIAKVLSMAEGTTPPNETFKFSVSPKSLDGDPSDLAKGKMPPIPTQEIAYNSMDPVPTADNGMVTFPKEEGTDMFNGLAWPHAGVYVYTIREIVPNPQTSGITYSQAAYDIHVYVANGTNGLYVAAVGAYLMVNDGGTAVPGTPKVPGEEGGDPLITGDYSGIAFTNKYLKSGGGVDPKEPNDHVLDINKTVAGNELGDDYGDRSKYFSFVLTVQKPASLENEQEYKAYVVEPDPSNVGKFKVVTTTDNYATLQTDPTYGPYIKVTTSPSATMTINLKHNQHLVFVGDMHYGSSYKAVEAAVENYTAKVVVTENGGTPITLSNGAPNTARSTLANDSADPLRIVGQSGKNIAAFTNTYKEVTPMGIAIDDMPYIILIGVALIALAAYVVVRTRRNSRDEE